MQSLQKRKTTLQEKLSHIFRSKRTVNITPRRNDFENIKRPINTTYKEAQKSSNANKQKQNLIKKQEPQKQPVVQQKKYNEQFERKNFNARKETNNLSEAKIWEMLRPFEPTDKPRKSVIEYIRQTNNMSDSVKMDVPEVIKLAIAKYMLEQGGGGLNVNGAGSQKFRSSTNLEQFIKSTSSGVITGDEKEQIQDGNNERQVGGDDTQRPDQLEKLKSKKKLVQGSTYLERSEVKVIKPLNEDKPVNYAIPKKVLTRFMNLSFHLDARLLQKLLRPQIYFDIEPRYRRQNRYGRIVFQLFTESCPGVVLEFVRNCAANRYKNFHFHRIYERLWVECSLAVENSPLLENRVLEIDKQCLNHGLAPGMLSFPTSFLEKTADRDMINFNISFAPLKFSSSHNQRIAFGVLHHGQWILRDLQKLSTKSGKPAHAIRVAKCGALNYV